MNAQQIRQAYLDFYKKRNHEIIPRALLVPLGESSVLFTGSGMQPLIPYLLGETHPKGNRLVNSQTCLRAQDIEEVGDNRHTTFFEMLGNWSLGDYFKKEQLPWFYEFLIDVVGLDPTKLYATVFIGNEEYGLPRDDVSAELLQDIFKSKGIDAKIAEIGSEEDGYKKGMKPGERIFFYDSSKNWWAPEGKPSEMSEGQPGGPDSEVFYDFGEQNGVHEKWVEQKIKDHIVWHKVEDVSLLRKTMGDKFKKCHPNCDCGRFLEIGNSVFMEYVRTKDGFEKLPKQNVDFGGGLERIAAAKIGNPDVFKISVLWPIIEKLEKLSGKRYTEKTEDMRVIADHLRGAMFLAIDGVKPSNKEQGYVMRRLMRRAILKAFDLGIEQNIVQEIAPVIAELYRDDFPELLENEQSVIEILIKEEKVFKQTIRKGYKQLDKFTIKSNQKSGDLHNKISGDEIFELYDTHGFPVEISVEVIKNRLQAFGLTDNWEQEFEAKMQEQRQRSQTAAKGVFKGGLGGQTLQHKKYHTATHLMYESLRRVLGNHVVQHGSNITEERLRFDFSHPEKMTEEQIKQVEDLVNEQIKANLDVSWKEYPLKEAQDVGVLGQFGDRYGEIVKVYSMGKPDTKPYSFEICGGPHVDNTAQLAEDGKTFKIVKEQASSAGIRRIKAVLQ